MMRKHPLVQIRGTPGSGKTTILQLLSYYIETCHPEISKVISFACWPAARATGTKTGKSDEETPAEWYAWERWFLERCGVTKEEFVNTEIVILIDDGESSYDDGNLWHILIKTRLEKLDNLRILIALDYGSISEDDDDLELLTPASHILTPLNVISDDQIISLYASGQKPGVFFTESEYKDLVGYFTESKGLRLPEEFEKDLFYRTGGHCAATYDLLDDIFSSTVSLTRQ